MTSDKGTLFVKKVNIKLSDEHKEQIVIVLQGNQLDLLLFMRVLLSLCTLRWNLDRFKIGVYIPDGLVSSIYGLCSVFNFVTVYPEDDVDELIRKLETDDINYFVYDTNALENRTFPTAHDNPSRRHLVDAFCKSLGIHWGTTERSTYPILSFPMESPEGFYTATIIQDRLLPRPKNRGYYCFAHFCDTDATDPEAHWGYSRWHEFISKMILANNLPWITSSMIVKGEYMDSMQNFCYIKDDVTIFDLLRSLAMSNLFVGMDGVVANLAVALRIPTIIFAPYQRNPKLYQHKCFWVKYITEPIGMVIVNDVLSIASASQKIYAHVN